MKTLQRAKQLPSTFMATGMGNHDSTSHMIAKISVQFLFLVLYLVISSRHFNCLLVNTNMSASTIYPIEAV